MRNRRLSVETTLARALAVAFALTLVLGACAGGDGDEFEKSPKTSVPRVSKVTFRFGVIGDFGTGGEETDAVAEDLRRWATRNNADAILTTGDNIYEDGEPAEFDDGWIEPYGWAEEQGIDVIASLGNHDIRSDDGEPVMDLLDMPDRWYSKTVGDAEVFVLEANNPAEGSQIKWLERSLERSDAVWKIAVFHQPAYSCSSHDSTPGVVRRWVPIFEKHEVDLVLNGHDHNYQRFATTNGVTYVVTGGGGNPELYPLDECPEGTPERVAADDDRHHFVAIEGSSKRLRVEAIATNGSTIDRFSLTSDGS